jgi:hypothetical protein
MDTRFFKSRDFLIDNADQRLVCHSGNSNRVQVWNKFAILGDRCFKNCEEFKSITFKNESRLTRFEESHFLNCSMKSICISRKAVILQNLNQIHLRVNHNWSEPRSCVLSNVHLNRSSFLEALHLFFQLRSIAMWKPWGVNGAKSTSDFRNFC